VKVWRVGVWLYDGVESVVVCVWWNVTKEKTRVKSEAGW